MAILVIGYECSRHQRIKGDRELLQFRWDYTALAAIFQDGQHGFCSYRHNNAQKCDIFNETLHTRGVREGLGPQKGEGVC